MGKKAAAYDKRQARNEERRMDGALKYALGQLEATPKGGRDNMILKMCVWLHNKRIGEAQVIAFQDGVRRIYPDVDVPKLMGKFTDILRGGYAAGNGGVGRRRRVVRAVQPSSAGLNLTELPPPPHRSHFVIHRDNGSATALETAPIGSKEYAAAKVMGYSWNSEPYTSDEAWAAYNERQCTIGFVPASLWLLIIDVDSGSPDMLYQQIRECGIPVTRLPTRKGAHLAVFATSLCVNNASWRRDDCAGDIRSGKGYVVMHGRRYMEALGKAMYMRGVDDERLKEVLCKLLKAGSTFADRPISTAGQSYAATTILAPSAAVAAIR